MWNSLNQVLPAQATHGWALRITSALWRDDLFWRAVGNTLVTWAVDRPRRSRSGIGLLLALALYAKVPTAPGCCG